METRSHHVETVRHGDKKGNDLSELGVEQAREKAAELWQEIQEAPPGTVFYTMSSNVGRAVQTRNTIEQVLKELATGSPDVSVLSVHDVQDPKGDQRDMSKKYLVTDTQPQRALGFTDATPSIPEFLRLKALYKNDENLIGLSWAATSDEISELHARVETQLPGTPTTNIHPRNFNETPEEAALLYLRLMKRMTDITEKYFPGHHSKSLHVGHNLSADFAAMALLGKDISMNSVDELGGKFRDFLEKATYEIRDNKVIASYRDQSAEQEVPLENIINQLEEASKKRRTSWENV